MPKPIAIHPTNDAVEPLKTALAAGHTVVLSRVAPPHVDRTPPLVATCRLAFGLTEAEARMLLKLLECEHVSRQGLHAAMYPPGGVVTGMSIVNVVVTRLRQKLAQRGIAIVTIWGLGYRLEAASRDQLRKSIAAYDAGIADATTQMKTKSVAE